MKAAFSAIALLLAPVPALAQAAEPEFIAVERLPEGEGRAQIDWRIDAAGSLRATLDSCPQCAGLSLRRYEFTVDPSHYRRIAELLPRETIRTALNAPCTLPHATYGWLRQVGVIYRSGNVESHTGFVRECQSPELDALRARLASASQIVVDLIRTSGAKDLREP